MRNLTPGLCAHTHHHHPPASASSTTSPASPKLGVACAPPTPLPTTRPMQWHGRRARKPPHLGSRQLRRSHRPARPPARAVDLLLACLGCVAGQGSRRRRGSAHWVAWPRENEREREQGRETQREAEAERAGGRGRAGLLGWLRAWLSSRAWLGTHPSGVAGHLLFPNPGRWWMEAPPLRIQSSHRVVGDKSKSPLPLAWVAWKSPHRYSSLVAGVGRHGLQRWTGKAWGQGRLSKKTRWSFSGQTYTVRRGRLERSLALTGLFLSLSLPLSLSPSLSARR